MLMLSQVMTGECLHHALVWRAYEFFKSLQGELPGNLRLSLLNNRLNRGMLPMAKRAASWTGRVSSQTPVEASEWLLYVFSW